MAPVRGSPEYWVGRGQARPGYVEIAGVSDETAREALRLASPSCLSSARSSSARRLEKVVDVMKAQ